jgi:thiosulfate dehydrogenase
MVSRVTWFVIGIATAMLITIAGVFIFVKGGGVPMETTAPPLPFEQTLASMALRSSIGDAAARKNPIALNEGNLLAGVQVFKENFAVGMFPQPPQLFTPDEMVTDDPEGVTFWKVTHGIRLSGMPGFGATLSDTQRWQVTMLAAHADKLPPVVQAALSH